MKTKKFVLTVLAIAAICSAAVSTTLFANDETTVKCFDNTMYMSTTDSTGNDNGSGDGVGGPIIPPTGH
jgi:hypothetical protein